MKYVLIKFEPILIDSDFIFFNSYRIMEWNDNAATLVNSSDIPTPVLAETAQNSAFIFRATSAARFSIILYISLD